MISWLQQQGPKAKKHTQWAHPVITCILHYAVVALITTLSHDWMINKYQIYCTSSSTEDDQCYEKSSPTRRRYVGIFFALYFVFFLVWRLTLQWKETKVSYCEFYRLTFLCGVTIFNAALSLYTNRPVVATAFCVAVGIDQLLWYFDLAGYLILGKCPIGVTSYLFWPGTSWASRISSTHHLWTIPLVLWASNGMHILSLPLSSVIVVSNVLLSRWMTPHSVVIDEEVKYLNINLSHELWTDVKMKFLLCYDDKLPYLLRLFVAWLTFNSIVFALLYTISARLLGEAPVC